MKKWLIIFLMVFIIGFVSSIPGIPHQFYGEIIVNGQPTGDNNIITAKIGGDNYNTISKNGFYGYSPNIFYIEDPKGNREGDIL